MYPNKRLKATVNCDMGEGYALYTIGDDENLMKIIHLANVACGFHASDFSIMDHTVKLAKQNGVLVGAHPSLPDKQGFGRREMAMDPDELESCFTYQIGALSGFLLKHQMKLNHVKPHGAVYGMTARSAELAAAMARVVSVFNKNTLENGNGNTVALVGLPDTYHEIAAKEAGLRFIPEWFADLEYTDEGKLIITKKHKRPNLEEVEIRVKTLLSQGLITTQSGKHLPLSPHPVPGEKMTMIDEVSICCHSDTPGALEITTLVKRLVDESNYKL